jgi:phosphoribosylanthranilate isomerase
VEIVAEVAPFVTVVALFVDASKVAIEQVLAAVPVDVIQFHGQESATYCEQFERPYLKAVRVKPGLDLAAAIAPYGRARGVLLDSWQDGVPGGTGKTFDWQLASGRIAKPMVLAGGLDAANVGAAMAQLHPAGVDVSGGVESSPGIKCPRRIAEFVRAVRAADLINSGDR